jgi:hypothetical protein
MLHYYWYVPYDPHTLISYLLAGVDRKGPQLFMIEPSGLSYGYFGCAAGKAAASARTLIEKLDLKNMKCEEAVIEAAKMYSLIVFTFLCCCDNCFVYSPFLFYKIEYFLSCGELRISMSHG